MNFNNPILTKDPRQFRNQQIKITQDPENYYIDILPGEMTFPEMIALRTERDPSDFEDFKELTLANIGLSAALVINIAQQEFLVTVKQHRMDVGDTCLKLISGYIPAEQLATPEVNLADELAEELLIFDREDGLLSGSLEETPLPKPYRDRFDCSSEAPYSIHFKKTLDWFPCNKNIYISGNKLYGDPQLYFFPATNSAQLVYHLSLNNLENKSLYHAEEKYNSSTQLLETHIYHSGLLLLPTYDKTIQKQVFSLQKNRLEVYDETRTLFSEFFSLKNNNITTKANVTIDDIRP